MIAASCISMSSPARARKQNTLVTERADIWSLGVMLFKITKGVMPFPSKDRVSESFSLILDFAEKDRVARFKQLELDPTNELHRLIGQMLDPNPLERPSAEEVLGHPSIAGLAGWGSHTRAPH
jgi:serine/threonine protein kinase